MLACCVGCGVEWDGSAVSIAHASVGVYMRPWGYNFSPGFACASSRVVLGRHGWGFLMRAATVPRTPESLLPLVAAFMGRKGTRFVG
jgi:hypothetical protein